ncbi:hypothetical protein P170DRAFT_435527 [Aspergillus steynii IBT 23096]|uniref:Uncharacterized protein n=1 Tax=Aspergillus steynii IBT 23096 TaxID=1392250 RepID=A0A2I2GBT9_9EURO|nr:uncharacterized protein P170DRAFT_435527 [Aspergillus steynii IBT 23096]PLB50325.1 hypothetical protein P170DRAFT_435527 [Aspergillus steynii IBT 23096]
MSSAMTSKAPSPTAYPQPEKPEILEPPFSNSASIRFSQQYTHPAGVNFQHKLIKPSEDLHQYLDLDLATPKLNRIHHLLWLAGLPRAARPLHRQKLMKRSFILTEAPDEHLVWSPGYIVIKPVPEYLLDHEFWARNICPHSELHASACGLLLSYAWLITRVTDFQIAKDERILPADVTWEAWTRLVQEFLDWMDNHPIQHNSVTHLSQPAINQRYEFGELRLSRLNPLYRLTPSTFSMHNLVFGFMPSSTWYRAFFEQNFSWILAVLVYMSLLLSAMQVGLATDELQGNQQFQRTCIVFTLGSIFFTVVLVGVMLVLWTVLFCYHIGFTILFHRRLNRNGPESVANL